MSLAALYGLLDEAASVDPEVLARMASLGMVSAGARPDVIGRGERGVVLRFPGMPDVVKLTDDPREAAVARSIVGQRLPGLVLVHAVDDLGSGVYALRLERLYPITSGEDLDALEGGLSWFEAGDDSSLDRVAAWEPRLAPMVRSIRRIGLECDLHDEGGGNVMRRADGSWVLADLGPF